METNKPSKWEQSQAEPSKWDMIQSAPKKEQAPATSMPARRLDGSESSIKQSPADDNTERDLAPKHGHEERQLLQFEVHQAPEDLPETCVLTPFSLTPKPETGEVEIHFQSVKLIEYSWSETGTEHDVSLDGVPLDGTEDSKVTIPIGSVIYGKLETTNKGVVVSVELTTMFPEEDEKHHVPPSEEGEAQDGMYIWEVATTRLENDTPVWVPYQATLLWCDYTREFINTGGTAHIHKKTTENAEDLFRGISGYFPEDYSDPQHDLTESGDNCSINIVGWKEVECRVDVVQRELDCLVRAFVKLPVLSCDCSCDCDDPTPTTLVPSGP